MKRLSRMLALCAVAIAATGTARAEYPLNYELSTTGNVGSGKFAPYFMASNNGGVLTQPISIMERGKLWKPITTDKRFSYGFGVDLIAQLSKGTDYRRYDPESKSFFEHRVHPSNAWVQQLWAGFKYRSIFLKGGMWEQDRSIFDSPLGIGDITESNNARPVPQLRAGFYDFVDIPFLKHALQVQGDIAYGKMLGDKWLRDHFFYYNSFITEDVWYHYKRLYFRTNPDMPFSATFGVQQGSQFGGTRYVYWNGEIEKIQKEPLRFRTFFDVFVQKPGPKGVAFCTGNSLGSLDIKLRYRFRNGKELIAYLQAPWEDGTSMGKLNGLDGVWGLEYKSNDKGWLQAASLVIVDFTNQSGHIHYAPADNPDSPITSASTGADDYYNNYFYNGWQMYGMGLGTPFVRSPLYNTNGYMRYMDNMVRGFQIGMMGAVNHNLSYRALFAYRISKGTPMLVRAEKFKASSLLLEADYDFPKVDGLSLKGQVAFDAGKLYGNNFGILLSLSYSGVIK